MIKINEIWGQIVENKYQLIVGALIIGLLGFTIFSGCQTGTITESDVYVSGMIMGDVYAKESDRLHDNDKANIELGISVLYSALFGDYVDVIGSMDKTIAKFVENAHDANIISDIVLLAYNRLNPKMQELFKDERLGLFKKFIEGFIKRSQIALEYDTELELEVAPQE
jgi:hypothetical protein